jgi:hypothetical protein
MGIKASRFDFTWLEKKVTDTKKLNESKKRFKKAFESSVLMIRANNDFLKLSLSEEEKIEYVENLIKKAYAFGIIDTFNVEYWLSDKVLTKEDFNSSRKF